MATQFQKAALKTVKVFRQKQIAGLEKHLRKFGPLPGFEVDTPNVDPNTPVPATLANPFLPYKYPKMRKWATPKFSLRRQAELVKKAQLTGTMDLLPPGPKKFAAEQRAERVMNSHSPAVLMQLAELKKKAEGEATLLAKATAQKKVKSARQAKELEAKLSELKSTLAELQEKYEVATAEYDRGELATFEAEADKSMSKAQIAQLLKVQNNLEMIKINAGEEVIEMEQAITRVEKKLDTTTRSVNEDWAWNAPVRWAPEYVPKKVAGSELGTKLYTGKKRMFKRHLWERRRAGRVRRTAMLMRDMPARIARYKAYYKKRRPNPLRPSRYSKAPKLPY